MSPDSYSPWEIQGEIRSRIEQRIARGETSQARLSRQTGISQGNISRFLSSKKGASTHNIYTLAEAAGLHITIHVAELELRESRFKELDAAIASEDRRARRQ